MSRFTTQYNFSHKGFNPLFWHVLEALRNPKIRYIFVEGGSSAAKTYSICQALLIDGFQNEYSTMTFRRQLVDVNDSVYSAFKMAANGMQLDYYDYQQHLFKGKDDKSNIRFRGLDDEENIKGIERFNIVYFNEFNQFEEHLFDQAKLRLRGRKNQKFVCDWNPISSKLWQYENLIDTQEWEDLPLSIEGREDSSLNEEYSFKRINSTGDSIWIKVTYRDNYWVVGRPEGDGGNIDTHTLDNFEALRTKKPNLYRIYANGERGVMRTGGEFWKAFNELRHINDVEIDPCSAIGFSCDQNVTPYVTITAWQGNRVEKKIKQIAEILCKTPNNNAVKSARVVCQYLDKINYQNVVYIYGDPSGSSRSVVDENSASFYDKFIAEIKADGYRVVSRVKKAHPAIAMSAAFVNEIYENNYGGWAIEIGSNCGESIHDYTTVQEDKDGTMFKKKQKDKSTGITHEPIGHISDTKRYFLTTFLEEEYNKFKSKKPNIYIT